MFSKKSPHSTFLSIAHLNLRFGLRILYLLCNNMGLLEYRDVMNSYFTLYSILRRSSSSRKPSLRLANANDFFSIAGTSQEFLLWYTVLLLCVLYSTCTLTGQ